MLTRRNKAETDDGDRWLDEKYPIMRHCRRLSRDAAGTMFGVVLLGAGPLFLAAAIAPFCFKGETMWSALEVTLATGIALTLLIVGRYMGAKWALRNICIQMTDRYPDGAPFIPSFDR